MSAFAHRFKQEISSRVSLTFCAGLILFVSLTGPFGTYAAYSLGQRLLVVTPLLLVLMLLGVVIRALVFSTLPLWRFRSACLLNGGLASLILAPLLDLFLHQIPPTDTVSYPGLGELLLLVFSLSLGMCALRRAVMSEHLHPPVAPEATPPAAPEAEVQPKAPPLPDLPRLLQRLDAEAHGSLWSISVRDHYVDVQTSRGVTSLLMRLSDAMAETSPVDGTQIHRSHWVAWAAVLGVERDGTKLFVALQSGSRLPVSKNHREKLVARGLL